MQGENVEFTLEPVDGDESVYLLRVENLPIMVLKAQVLVDLKSTIDKTLEKIAANSGPTH